MEEGRGVEEEGKGVEEEAKGVGEQDKGVGEESAMLLHKCWSLLKNAFHLKNSRHLCKTVQI